MASYLVRRLAGTVPVLLLISLLVFLLIHAAPGDPTLLLLGEETNAAQVEQAKERWGLNQPLYIQYLKFVQSAAVGDFGRSFKYTEPVMRVIMTRLPATIELAQPIAHQLPQIKADLRTDKCKSALLRTTIVIQLAAPDLPRLQASELRIIDSVRTYLRDQERQNLVGKQGTDKLRTDLTNIINGIIAPASIHSMLFKELVLQ